MGEVDQPPPFLGQAWCVSGELTTVAALSERSWKGAHSGDMEDFTAFIEEVTLVDIDMAYGRFTWSTIQADASCSGLGRLLISVDWEDHHPHVQVLPLARSVSDHKLILLKTNWM